MYEVEYLILASETIVHKKFYSYYEFEQFIKKCKYSKKVKIIGWKTYH